MRRLRRCKIVATLGPASTAEGMLAKLFQAGVDVFRVNMSHTSHDNLRKHVAAIRAVGDQFNRPACVLVDLQGPKLRIGTFVTTFVDLLPGARFTLDSNPEPGDENRVFLPHPEILSALRPGHTVLIDDGKVRLHVVEADSQHAVAVVDIGGSISNRKGVSLPDTEIAVSAMTPKDHSDLEAALEIGVDWIAASFVQRPEDVAEIKAIVDGRALVMSKIEKPQALTRLDEIISLSDGLMVARGDLGVELPLEKVPGIQKRITRRARRQGKPVVIATQMLESMINAAMPTRAEVSDVAQAVFEGADAIMLSAESAVGKYPIEAVSFMDRIASEVETDPLYRSIINAQRAQPEPTAADAIAVAARDMAETLELKAVVAWTSSGSTAFRIARERVGPPILALTPHIETARRLAIVWGVHPLVTKDAEDVDDMVDRACVTADSEGFAEAGDRIIIIGGVPFGERGGTNMMRIALLKREDDVISSAPLPDTPLLD
ncbi:pyruvate kinase [Beijerinckia sp. L45]|uniref:pyruvate kinase n=1 Tax=Beijerinckia sp. L45 TaxID=1641855 RepID=UPI00131E7927|nr:pyruvate kinase [Beijerinckia sp. L45]